MDGGDPNQTMRIVVSDTSCLIDLRKAVLLEAFTRLPYEILIPDVLFESELVRFSQADRDILTQNGVQIAELLDPGVERVIQVQAKNNALSVNDCFAYVLAEQHAGCILLTGDKALRTLAHAEGIETHGVLWILDEMLRCSLVPNNILIEVLCSFDQDDTVRLPTKEIQKRIIAYQRNEPPRSG